MLAVDAAFTVIWLSAFATQAAYNSSGLCGQACNISKGVVALGIFVWYVYRCLPVPVPFGSHHPRAN